MDLELTEVREEDQRKTIRKRRGNNLMKNEIPIDELSAMISEKEKELYELKREYREKRTAGLKAAMEAKRDAEKLVRDELKALGYSDRITSDFHPFRFTF